MALRPPAEAITIGQSLALLDGNFQAFANGVVENRYALWLGSGISLGRLDGLQAIVPRVVEFLRARVDHRHPNCRFLAALQQALELAQLSEEERCRVELTRPFEEWHDSNAIINRLINRYSQLLDIVVEGEDADFLLWNGVDVVSTFANPLVEPDVEHLCIGILVLEGVASDIASANWDGLVEKALDTLTGGQPTVVVFIRPADLREPDQAARMIKFHGCALKASADEQAYRQYLVARHSQIVGWTTYQENVAIVNRLIDLITTKPTLMMGLSTQDANIQAIFAAAEARMAWPWPGERPSCVLSENRIGVDQRSLLRNVYRAAYTPETHQQILDGALIQAYAKPLLVSLVLYVLCAKLRVLVGLAPGALQNADRQHLQLGIVTIRDQLAAIADEDRLTFVHDLISTSGRVITIFRSGEPARPQGLYHPITSNPIQRIAADAELQSNGLPEFAVAAGILGLGIRDGIWSLDFGDVGQNRYSMRIDAGGGPTNLFLVANSYVAMRLQHFEILHNRENTVVIYSLEKIPSQHRSPRRAPGRTGIRSMREVSIAELMNQATSARALVQRFREDAAL